MGLRFYIGASGSGKSYQLYNHIIQQSMANPHINYLIVVPDQFTMQTQLEMVMRHPNKGIMNIDVLSFGRLSHRIFEEVGGNDKPVLDDTGKSLVLRRVAAGLEDELGVMKRNIRKPGYISEVKSALSEFMQYGLGTKEVEKLCEYAAKRNALAYKLKDLHLLYEGFLNYINERYITTEETLDLLRKVLPRSKVVKGSVIVFDGFTGFTPVQYNVIQELMVQAQELIVTVTMGAEENAYVQDGEQKLFHLSKKTIHDLDRRCKDAGVRREADERITDSVVYRYRDNAGLAHLERALFRYPVQEYQGTQDSIRLFEASAPKEELRQVCLEIRRLVRERKEEYEGNAEFRMEGNVLVLPLFTDEVYTVLYYPSIPRITSETSDEEELSIPDKIAAHIPYFVKGDLFRDDEPNEANEARNWFEAAMEQIIATKQSYSDKVFDKYSQTEI